MGDGEGCLMYNKPCGRRTRGGAICEQPCVTGWNMPSGADVPASCYAHLTAAERTAYRDAVSEQKARWAAVEAAHFASEPACWSWTGMPDPATWEWEPEAYLAGRSAGIVADARGDAMIRSWQDGRCAICDRRENLIEDHDHVTGLVRGYLCRSCNTREGIYRGPASPYGRYRERHPANMLGLRMVYFGPFHESGAKPQSVQELDTWADNAMNGVGL